jgi:mannosyltransferase OCH1-like enzyme
MIKHIFILWFQGFEQAPEIVKKCLNSWIYYNPDWKIIQLNESNLHEWVDINEWKKEGMLLCHLSDMIRIFLLEKYGGVWVDSTLFCNRPLTQWLPNYIQSGFFGFSRPSNDYILSSWFLYSEPNHVICRKIGERISIYFRQVENMKKVNYLILHDIINELYQTNKEVKEELDKMTFFHSGISIFGGIGPLFLSAIDLFNRCTPEIDLIIQCQLIPVFKLTYKCDYSKNREDTIISHLFRTISL